MPPPLYQALLCAVPKHVYDSNSKQYVPTTAIKSILSGVTNLWLDFCARHHVYTLVLELVQDTPCLYIIIRTRVWRKIIMYQVVPGTYGVMPTMGKFGTITYEYLCPSWHRTLQGGEARGHSSAFVVVVFAAVIVARFIWPARQSVKNPAVITERRRSVN